MSPRISIAIVGGGIAGCTLANGLLHYPHIEFDVFESRATFTERGASVSLAANAVSALRTMGMDVDQAMADAGAMAMTSTQYLAAVGEHKGEQLFELPAGIISVMRSKWLEELLRHLPEDRLHPNKKLASVTQPPQGSNGSYTLHFEDGATHEADAVIGCDGIRSKIRDIILGSENKAIFGGYWDACARMSPQKAAEQFGTKLFDPFKPVEVALIGQGASMLFVPNTNGEVYNVIVAAAAGKQFSSAERKIKLTREFLEDAFSDWDIDFRTTVIDIILSSESGAGVVYTQWESPSASTYYQSRLCIMGDSAHSTIPWLGQGACMAMEDAAVLARLLGVVKSSTELEAAFKAFDRTRRGRPEHIMTQSREAAKVLTGQMGLDPSRLKTLNVPEWWKRIWSFDMQSHVQEAIKHFQALTSVDRITDPDGDISKWARFENRHERCLA